MTKTIWAVVGVSVLATVAMAVALAIVLSGGGDDDPEPQTPAPFSVGGGAESGGAAPEGLEEFRACLEGEGVEPPTGGEAPRGDELEALQDAIDKCRDQLPSGAFLTPFGGGVPQN
jgi:hypothetical protein